jgi:hypothetical protein
VRKWDGGEANGIADIAKAGSYCWKATLKPLFELSFVPAPAGGCSGVLAGYKPLANPYSAFVVNALGESRAPVGEQESPVAEKVAIIDLPQSGWHAAATSAADDYTTSDIRDALDKAGFEPTGGRLSALVHTILKSPPSGEGTPVGRIAQRMEPGDLELPRGVCFQGAACSNASVLTWKPDARVTLRLVAIQATALQVAEALTRCEVHGIPKEACLAP